MTTAEDDVHTTDTAETLLSGGGRTTVTRNGDVVFREVGPWAASVQSLLRHLERVGFAGAPRVIGAGFDARGRETLSFVSGEVINPKPWPDDAMHRLGHMLRAFHDATASFIVPGGALWQPWFCREIGGQARIIGHCDTAPWNVVSRDGSPVAFVDWELAGPIDPRMELAHTAWCNVRLFDDDVAAREGLAAPEVRARQIRLFLDGYALPRADRVSFVDTMIAFAIHAAAWEAIEPNVTHDTQDVTPLWAIAWRTRSAAWMLRHRTTLEHALL